MPQTKDRPPRGPETSAPSDVAPRPSAEAIALREHILNRLSYGPAPWERLRYDQIGPEAFITLHLTGTLGWVSLPPMEPWPISGGAVQQDLDDAGQPATITDARDVLLRLFLDRGTQTVRQLEAVLSDFWLNHFNVFALMGISKWQIDSYLNGALAPHLTGSFADMLHATALHPAMLQYLDNRKNAATKGFWDKHVGDFFVGPAEDRIAVGPNENYAREVMELHTLGVDAGYTQDDVIAAQRILTGWSSNFAGQAADLPAFHEAMHDVGPKQVMGVEFPSSTGLTGFEEVTEFLGWLAHHPATARHIAQKLVVRFIGEEAPRSVIDEVAVPLAKSDMSIETALAHLFASQTFRDPAVFNTRFKPPHRLAISALRSLGVFATDEQLDELVPELLLLGDAPLYYGPPTGYPDATGFWLSGSSMLGRFQIARKIANWPNVIDAATAATEYTTTTTDTELAAALVDAILPAGVSAPTLNYVTGHIANAAQHQRIAHGLEMIFASPEFGRY